MRYARSAFARPQKQTLLAHLRNVAAIAAQRGAAIGLPSLMELCGLLHDAGKAGDAFQAYLIHGGKRGSVEHAAYGAVYAYQRWHSGALTRKLAAEMVAFAVASHHGALPDLVNEEGFAFAEERLNLSRFDDQDEVMALFFALGVSPGELDTLFERAVAELAAKYGQIEQACADLPDAGARLTAKKNLFGQVQRSVFSLLLDADRWDAYCFEAEVDFACAPKRPWPLWRERLEARLSGFAGDRPINRLRAQISEECRRAGQNGAGIYRLCVPTGGGKTFASTRYALEAALHNGFERIVYVAPYKTILEQTARELRAAFVGDTPGDPQNEWILEHHSDYVTDESTDEQIARYQLLCQRWDEPLVLTTMVQLLNALFSGNGACARRFSALQNCVLLIDEAQNIPHRCMQMFTLALRYLWACCGCAVVLCTATQPLLEEVPVFPLCAPQRMIADEAALYHAFKRVNAVDLTREEMTADALAGRVCDRLAQDGSALCIVNTKAVASALYAAFRARLPADVPCYCLTTAQCPQHRLALLADVSALLKGGKPVVCVSTQLIEAGVDVSFGLVVRALAGLYSVAQAAGRCNRNRERPMGEVWLVRIAGESLRHLMDIQIGQEETLSALDACRANPGAYRNDLLSPELLTYYGRHLIRAHAGEMGYPTGDGKLIDLLSANAQCTAAYFDRTGRAHPSTALTQAFRTAGRRFSALDASPFTLLVPYGRGEELISRLRACDDLRQSASLLRQAQRYTVTVFPYQIENFKRAHCIQELGSLCCFALDKGYYDDFLGVIFERKEMELYAI